MFYDIILKQSGSGNPINETTYEISENWKVIVIILALVIIFLLLCLICATVGYIRAKSKIEELEIKNNTQANTKSNEIKAEIMYCKHCGAQISKDDMYCNHCGKQQ